MANETLHVQERSKQSRGQGKAQSKKLKVNLLGPMLCFKENSGLTTHKLLFVSCELEAKEKQGH